MNSQDPVNVIMLNKIGNLATTTIRRSSNKQEGNNSFEIQKLAIKEYAAKKGYYLPDEFIFYDDATSAYRKSASQRTGLNLMKDLVLSQDISAIIFYDFSRIDRKIYSFVSEFYYDVIAKKPHIKFFTTTKEEEWTPMDLDVKLHLIIANAESNEKSRRAVDAQKKDLESDIIKRPGSTVPFGYKQVDKKLIPSNDAPTVLLIFYLAAWGYSIQKIADILNDACIPSPSKKKWRSSSVENIIKNNVYMGHLSWKFRRKQNDQNEHLIKNQHEMIVPSILYWLIDINRELKQKYNKLETPFLFGGLLVCKSCGHHLLHRNSSTTKNGMKYSYFKYFCTNCSYEIDADIMNEKLLGYTQLQFSISVKLNYEFVSNAIREHFKILQEHLISLQAKEQLVLANEKVLDLEQQTNLSNVFKNVKNKYKEEIFQVKQSINKLEILLTPTELEVFLTNFQKIDLTKLSTVEQRLIMLNFIEKIEVIFNKENEFEFAIQFKINPISLITC